MAFNGSGIFNRLYNWVQDAANGIAITASRMDAETQGIADGLSNCITKDGQSSPSADIPFNNKKITGSGGVASSPATDLPFYVGASQYARITAAGRTVLGGGAEATTGSNAAGLQLPAAATSGVYLGNTANSASNALDWYEEGSFTPVVSGDGVAGVGTYTTQTGQYLRVGNTVKFTIRLIWTAHTGTGNFAPITGLPFTAASGNTNVVSVYWSGLTTGANKIVGTYVPGSTASITISMIDISAGTASFLPFDTAVTGLFITGFYFV